MNRRSTALERPVFIFGGGWRTGSTLLQRVLCSHPAIHVWGENHNLLRHFRLAAEAVAGTQKYSEHHHHEFAKHGVNGWIAMMNPPPDRFRDGLRAFLGAYYAEPALEASKERWGFKDVCCDAEDITFLLSLYPESRFILIVRNPADCLASARATRTMPIKRGLLADVGGSSEFLKHWARLGESFLKVHQCKSVLLLRYEQVSCAPGDAVRRIAEFLQVDKADFDLRVFNVRRRGWLERDPKLTNEDREALVARWLWRTARKYGYTPKAAGIFSSQDPVS